MPHTFGTKSSFGAVQVADKVVRRAGEPVTYASQLNLIDKVPGLAKYVKR